MFFIMGISPYKGENIEILDENNNKLYIYYVCNCISFFFIPLIKYGKKYYIKNANTKEIEITQQEYEEMKNSKKVKYYSQYKKCKDSNSYTNEYCPICKNKLEDNYAYCPYCGQKQPKKG